jgi:hypothetical protein
MRSKPSSFVVDHMCSETLAMDVYSMVFLSKFCDVENLAKLSKKHSKFS